MASKSKVDFDRKDLKTPDAFFETVGSANRYFQENRTLVIASAAAVVVLFLGGVGFESAREHKADETAATFLRAADAIDQNNLSTASAALDNLAGSAGGIYGELAKLYRADLAVTEKKYDDALASYDDLSKGGQTPYIRQIALVGRGFALESAGRAQDAVAAYAAASAIEGPYREQALRAQLRTARATGKRDDIEAAIKGILEIDPETLDANDLSAELAQSGQGGVTAPAAETPTAASATEPQN